MMKACISILFYLLILIGTGCSAVKDDSYLPSIASLESNEILVMHLDACHWGCTQGSIKFKNGAAIFKNSQLILRKDEIVDLDKYFTFGKSLEESWGCSLPIEIGFTLKKGLRRLKSKEVQLYPCGGLPIQLVKHLKETPKDIPFWRLSEEEQNQIMKSITLIDE